MSMNENWAKLKESIDNEPTRRPRPRASYDDRRIRRKYDPKKLVQYTPSDFKAWTLRSQGPAISRLILWCGPRREVNFGWDDEGRIGFYKRKHLSYENLSSINERGDTGGSKR